MHDAEFEQIINKLEAYLLNNNKQSKELETRDRLSLEIVDLIVKDTKKVAEVAGITEHKVMTFIEFVLKAEH